MSRAELLARAAGNAPVEPRGVPSAELERALSIELSGEPGAVTLVDRRPMPYCSTFPLEELHIRLPGGVGERLVFKDLGEPGPGDPMRSVKPDFLREPMREIDVYNRVLAPSGLSHPGLRASVVDSDRGRYWLFIQFVDGAPLWQHGETELWLEAAEWLAELHARFAARARDLPTSLLRHDAGYYRRWLERAGELARWPVVFGDSELDHAWLARRVTSVVEWLEEQPTTLLHGEYCPANLLVERRADGARIRPIDWEMAGVGCGLLDLAALTSGTWSEAERRAMALAYREALPDPLRPPEGALLEGLDLCRLLAAVQWLGWAGEWRPPPEQAHDWQATALELAARIPSP